MSPETVILLIERARDKADKAQRRVNQLRGLADQARANLDLLRQYAGEYEGKSATRAGQRRDTAARENQLLFIDRLGTAVQTQVAELALRDKAVEAAEMVLVHCLKQQKSLETLMQRMIAAQRLRELRLDQKRTDEFAQRQFHQAKTHERPDHGDAP
jgi:flagellar export protein FliJ